MPGIGEALGHQLVHVVIVAVVYAVDVAEPSVPAPTHDTPSVSCLLGPPTAQIRHLWPWIEMSYPCRLPFPMQPSASLCGATTCRDRSSTPGRGYRAFSAPSGLSYARYCNRTSQNTPSRTFVHKGKRKGRGC
jgi:hypothetical protein